MQHSKDQYCYVLYNKQNNKTYNGYTVNLERRLRQHNAQISGGARFTTRDAKIYGPSHWHYLLVVKCCSTMEKRHALSLEWSIRYPTNKRPRPKMYNSAKGRIASLHLALTNEKFSCFARGFKIYTCKEFESEMRSQLNAYKWPLELLDIKALSHASHHEDHNCEAMPTEGHLHESRTESNGPATDESCPSSDVRDDGR